MTENLLNLTINKVSEDTFEADFIAGRLNPSALYLVPDPVTASADEINVLDGIEINTDELNYSKGLTGNIQNQLNGKQPSGDYAMASDVTAHTNAKDNPHNVSLSQLGIIASAAELNYCSGVTSNVQSQFNNILNLVYPVGSIYMSVSSTSPATLFGGTWEQLKDRFLLGSGDTYTNGTTGGSADTIVVEHDHTFTGTANQETSYNGKHSHNVSVEGEAASNGSHTHSVSVKGSTGEAGAHWISLNYSTGNLTAGDNIRFGTGNSTRKFEFDAHEHSVSATGTAASNGAHTHSILASGTTLEEDAHTHTITPSGSISTEGESGTNANLPPYLAVYMWKRTA